ncbi:membrane-associated phospholipid phosphatase [Rivularia sp. PCC 7116]|uniref:phosphatase PAP2 family protein n=1 Tax=Rivularia sp. PCC 7116 TaxID=373994 RepID=UPI00029ECF25|nr:phosphatase PAP2 family protein [Rivularia sp. PCC 7116]AFY57759.1 membrane-associated phospholipid phosphatase [Rivularia sp. PCC 7116]
MSDYTNKLIQGWKEQVSSRLSPLLSLLWVGGFAVAAFCVWGFFKIAEKVFAEETTEFDTAILQSIYEQHTPFLNQIMTGITFLGNGSTLIYLSCLVGIVLLVSRKFASAFTLIIVTSGGIGLNVWLKNIFARVRPALWERIVDAASYSFPSGHAMVSLVVYGFICYLLIANFRYWSSICLFLTTLLVLAIGFSRLYLGVHYPTDIIAGYAAGLVWLISCILSLEILQFLFGKQNQKAVSD